MQLGSSEHKAQVCQDLIKTYYENIWKEEIQIMEFDERLGRLRKQKAALDLELDQKGKPAANSEKKALAKLEADIESVQAAIKGKEADKEFWSKRIELVKRYEEQN
jgi:hypothetical protein